MNRDDRPRRTGVTLQRKIHVEELCHEHGIQLNASKKTRGGRANPRDRSICIPPVTGIRSYYVALHEIGHVVLGYDYSAIPAPQEAIAWQWAFEHAEEPPSPGVEKHIFQSLWHYLIEGCDPVSHHFTQDGRLIPKRDDQFWKFLGALVDDSAEELFLAAKVLAYADGDGINPFIRPMPPPTITAQENTRRVQRDIAKVLVLGPTCKTGDLARVGLGKKAHIIRLDGKWNTFPEVSGPGTVYCGAPGIITPAPDSSSPCKACLKGMESWDE